MFDQLNMRSGPSTAFPIIRRLPLGATITLIGTNADLFKTAYGGSTGYVNSNYVQLIGTASAQIRRGNTLRKEVALTFDGGSDLGYTGTILDTLAQFGVLASFGLTGDWTANYPDSAARIVRKGHQVINHTLNHPSYTGSSAGSGPLSPAKRLIQLFAFETKLQNAAGIVAKPYWRPPFGDVDSTVLRDVGAAGYSKTIMWTVDTMGWDGATPSTIFNRVMDSSSNGQIVLMHVGSQSDDYLAVDDMIIALRKRGYGLVKVSRIIAP